MKYRCILADPPWSYSDKMLNMRSTGNGATAQYRTMDEQSIQMFLLSESVGPLDNDPLINDVIAEDAHLWLWVTNAFMEAGHRVARAWGFEPKTIATWVKGRLDVSFPDLMGTTSPERNQIPLVPKLVQHIGQGHFLRNSTEHIIFATRGRCPALVKNLPTAFVHPGRWEGRLHSEKPPTIHEWAEVLSPGPRLELFARRRRPNWDAVGDEL